MVNGIVKCGYCKEKVSRNCYGKHLLSKRHREAFLKENRKVIDECFYDSRDKKEITNITVLPIFNVDKESCCICFCCKRFYYNKESEMTLGRLDAHEHLRKNPNCKANYLAELKKFTIPKKQPVNSIAPVNTKEVDELKARIIELEEEAEESAENNMIYFNMLKKMLGTGEVKAMIERFEEVQNDGLLPFYKNEASE